MKIKYILISILLFLCIIPNVHAKCGKSDMIRIKDIANAITITAQYAKDEHGKDTGYYNLIIEGLTNELYMIETTMQKEYHYSENGKLTINDLNGNKYKFKVYYEACDSELIRIIDYKLPKYNHYARDPLCEGLSEELDVCNRTYQEEITEEMFKQKIEEYTTKQEEIRKEENKIINKIVDFLIEYYFYVIIVIILIVGLTSAMVINKKRGALE